MIYDLVIIGGGPAGLSAAIYAARAGLNYILIEKFYTGGQVANTYEIENYPGLSKLSGPELIEKFEQHANEQGLEIVTDEVLDVSNKKSPFTIKGKKNEYQALTIIIATGARPRLLDVPGEKEFSGRGVSYCATCDGAFYKDKTVAVLGSGNTAVEDALFLSKMCKKVYVITRSGAFKATTRKLVKSMDTRKNIEKIFHYQATNVIGDNENGVTSLEMKNVKTNESMTLQVNGIFVAIGVIPNSDFSKTKFRTDSLGYIDTYSHMETSVEGIFAAGDARNTPLKQVITAAADGAIAASYAALRVAEYSG